PGILRAPGRYYFIQSPMYKNYLTIIWRTFRKEKGFATINFMGLLLGIVTSLIIFLWVQDEMKYNTFTKENDRLYKVIVRMNSFDKQIWTTTPYPLRDVLLEQYPFVGKAFSVSWSRPLTINKENDRYKWSTSFINPVAFDVLDIPFIQGSLKTFEKKPGTIVISDKCATQYFGGEWRNEEVIGKSIETEYGVFEIAGVFENITRYSTVQFDAAVSFETNSERFPGTQRWGDFDKQLFITVKENDPIEPVGEQVINAIREYRTDHQSDADVLIQPFNELYLYDQYENGEISGGRIDNVRIMGVGAVLVLLISCFNFMNLSIARYGKRARETGVRKVLGALKTNIRTRFLLESFLLIFMGGALAITAVRLALPKLNIFFEKQIELPWNEWQAWAIFISFLMALSVISGIYPSMVMAAVDPVKSLKGSIITGKFRSFFKKTLLVVQFTISVIMIVASFTVYRQVDYIMQKNLGLDRFNLVKLNLGMDWSDAANSKNLLLKNDLGNIPNISSSSLSDSPLGDDRATSDPFWPGKPEDMQQVFNITNVDDDFLSTTRIELIKGQDLREVDFNDSTTAYLVNETAVKIMDMEDPIGQQITFWGSTGQITGVVRDYNFGSLHQEIRPMIIRYNGNRSSQIMVRITDGQAVEAMEAMKTIFKKHFPDQDFDYEFMDEVYTRQYKNELMVRDLAFFFAIITIFISCLGLLGLAAFSAEQRTRETSIRKVLGASGYQIFGLLSREFVLLTLAAIGLAFPLAYFIMNEWLSGFAYRVDTGWGMYALTAFVTLFLALLTVFSQTIRTVLVNPAEILKSE
ncbi:MAG: ABC transporter permease, partial [Cyclobacteriaceae bacterium]|nr:ABC transporter permease [Cyclobacteriaceae bacterium]